MTESELGTIKTVPGLRYSTAPIDQYSICYGKGFGGIDDIDTRHASKLDDQGIFGHSDLDVAHWTLPDLPEYHHIGYGVHLGAPDGIAGDNSPLYLPNNTSDRLPGDDFNQDYLDINAIAGGFQKDDSFPNSNYTDPTYIPDFFCCPFQGCLQVFGSYNELERHNGEHSGPTQMDFSAYGVDRITSDGPLNTLNTLQDLESKLFGEVNYQIGNQPLNYDMSLAASGPGFYGTTIPTTTNLNGALVPPGTLAIGPATETPNTPDTSGSALEEPTMHGSKRAIKPAARRQSAATTARHRCNHPGCTKDYKRIGDLERHRLEKHMAGRFPCTYPACDRKGERAFGRADKLRDHVRQKHNLKI